MSKAKRLSITNRATPKDALAGSEEVRVHDELNELLRTAGALIYTSHSAFWEALLGRLKNSPRDHAQIAVYLATLEGEAASTWRLREALKAIAGRGWRK